MRMASILFAAVFSLAGMCLGQQNPDKIPAATITLTTSAETALPPIGGVFAPIRCDSDGNIYFMSEFSPLLRLAPNGELTEFQVESIDPGAKRPPRISAFALGPNSEVFALSENQPSRFSPAEFGPSWYIIRFDSSGHYRSKTRLTLPENTHPTAFAVFARGGYLVSGQWSSSTGSREVRHSFTAIVDDSGQFANELQLKEERQKYSSNSQQISKNEGVGPAIVVTSKDGNAYVMRSISDLRVYVVSPSGEVLRVLKIVPPEHFEPTTMYVANGKLMFTFQQRTDRKSFELLYVTYDTYDGRELNRYRASSDTKGILACYTGQEFTFIGVHDGKRVLIHAGL